MAASASPIGDAVAVGASNVTATTEAAKLSNARPISLLN
ncbi:hypothetical protein MPS_5325 [Mycobacterium pseudoshottsii JCM 15466]|nr:hypothetical protein MMSP_4191 [Mycobacterium sp. 012931]EPQ75753.1 hypothetical protein MMMB2_0413 [Mycobacterium marinum MB2]EPQ79617.1 hypothetical protein MMEU_0141 [Mycobacterium marinum str. Europe]GAQ40716.1 hypothetical protein MPS_5325 [Mycobacterium pseudoshottsii JCM 15466]